MACTIPYIQEQSLSETEKSRLESIHVDIFKQAKDSKAFREVDNRLQTVKSLYNKATEFVGKINSEYGPVSRLNSIGNGNSVLSVDVLPLTNEKQEEIAFQLEEPIQSVASEDTIKKVKEVAKKMGVVLQDIVDYSKGSGLDLGGVNGVADLTRGIIAIAEGKEGVAITEEMVHVATSTIEQTNPKLITE